MKKLLGTILAVAMLASVSTQVFAFSLTTEGGSSSQDVRAKYVAGSVSDTVYNVDVSWDAMQFTYTAPSEGTWDPETHAYTDTTTEGTWKGDGTITLTNHSNTGITVDVTYTQTDADIVGTFDKPTFDLETAEGTDYDSAPTDSAELTLSGELDSTATDLTTVGLAKITISAKVIND